jgi:hypothetical protein
MIRIRFYPVVAAIVIGGFIIWFVGVILQPHGFIETTQGIYQTVPVKSGEQLSLSFVHSVQRTPVIENFTIEDSGIFILESTEYQSFGVGLPFLAEDGIFQAEKDKFVMKGMNRPEQCLRLRTGPEAKLSLTYAGRTIPLYSVFPAGTLVTVRVEPLYSRWF